MFSPTVLIFFTVFIDLIGFGIVLPLLPSYAAAFHVSDAGIGVLVASFSLMQFLLAHWWGRLSDRIGRRPVLLVGLAGSALSYLLFALAANFWVLLLSRIVAGGMGATVNVAQAYLADTTTPEQRARALGLIGAAFGLGFVVGPALGGISSRWGNATPGLIASALTGVNFLLAWRWLPEPVRLTRDVAAPVPVHWSRFTLAFGATACSTIAFTVLYVVFPLEVERSLGLDRHHAAYLFVLIGVVSAIVQGGLIGRLVPRFGERALIIAGSGCLALGLGLLPGAIATGAAGGGSTLLYATLMLVATGSALIGPSASSFVSRRAPAAEQGRTLGLLQSVGAAARFVGPLVAGGIASQAGARAAFYVASGVGALAGISAIVATTRSEP
jgi:multidrug resistance protein